MTISEIIQLLEDTMNQRLEEFVKLGKAARQLLEKKYLPPHKKACLTRIRMSMANIVKELEPCHGMIFRDNPSYKDLFDELTAFYDAQLLASGKDASQTDTDHTIQ